MADMMTTRAQPPRRVSVSVGSFYKRGATDLKMDLIAGHGGMERPIPEASINRPGLALAGFYEHFGPRRIQLIGAAEHAYLSHLSEGVRVRRLEHLFNAGIPCVVIARHKPLFPEIPGMAEHHGVPVLRTRMITRHFSNMATLIMEDLMAPRAKVQGTMLEVAGLGVLIEGHAGVGKSETALGLIKRGHALVSDDVTALKRESHGRLLGAPVGVTRHHMEIRGIGIIYVPAIYGVASVRGEKQLDLVVTLRKQDEVEGSLDRSGEIQLFRELLGVRVPQVLIPVAPGRDLVNIVETAAQEYKLRLGGQVAVRDLDERLKATLQKGNAP